MAPTIDIPTRVMHRRSFDPSDHGCCVTLREYLSAHYAEQSCVYELVDGALHVSPIPQPPHDWWARHVRDALRQYSDNHQKHLNCVSTGCEVSVPGRAGPTRIRPDLAAFRDYPESPPDDWDRVTPIVVLEVVSERRTERDTTRNRQLYWMAGGIAEYWIIDPREDPQEPTLIALVRKPGAPKWEEHIISFGKSHKSTALPRFTLNLKRPKRK